MISMRYKYQTEAFSNIPRLKQPTNQTKNKKTKQNKIKTKATTTKKNTCDYCDLLDL